MHDMSIHQRQRTGRQGPDVTASIRHGCFPRILALAPFQYDSGAVLCRVPGEPQITAQNGSRPPLEDHHGRTLTVKVAQRVAKRLPPIPVHAVVDRHIWRIDPCGSHVRADVVATSVNAAVHQASHEQGANFAFPLQSAREQVKLVTDPRCEAPSGPDDDYSFVGTAPVRNVHLPTGHLRSLLPEDPAVMGPSFSLLLIEELGLIPLPPLRSMTTMRAASGEMRYLG